MATEVIVSIDDAGRVSGATASDAEILAGLAGGSYRAVLTQPRGRSLSALGLWWALCGMIADNHPADLTKEAVSDVLKVECGHAQVWQDAAGQYRRTPKSIAFNAMSGEDFGKLLDKALFKASILFGDDLTAAVVAELERMGAPDLREAA